MDMDDHDNDFEALKQRLGYENVVKAEAFDNDGFPIEIGLIYEPTSATPWSVVEHFDCDPDEPTRGTSGRQDYATREEAEEHYAEFVRTYGPSAQMPSGGRKGP